MKTGLLHASAVTAVSETYSREIQTEQHGCGLHDILKTRDDHLFGIVNGVDYAMWDPATDPLIEGRGRGGSGFGHQGRNALEIHPRGHGAGHGVVLC